MLPANYPTEIHMLRILTALSALFSTVLFAQPPAPTSGSAEQVIQLSVFNPIQLHPEETSVRGVRLGLIYGKNHNLTGVDYAYGVNRLTGSMVGLQSGFWNDVDGDFTGWQSGAVNITRGDFLGLQSGAVNITKGNVQGVQSGLVNMSGSLEGVQFGIYNQSDDIVQGLQVGLLNFNGNKDPFQFLPIVNWHF